MKKSLLLGALMALCATSANAFTVYVDGKEVQRNSTVTSYNMEYDEAYFWYCINPHVSIAVDERTFLTLQISNTTSMSNGTALNMCWGGTCQEITLGNTLEKMGYLEAGVLNDLEIEAARDFYEEGDTFNCTAQLTLIPDGMESNPFKFTLNMIYPNPNPDAGVDGVASDEQNTVYYNLQGIRVDNPTPGQIYIKNGKKVIF